MKKIRIKVLMWLEDLNFIAFDAMGLNLNIVSMMNFKAGSDSFMTRIFRKIEPCFDLLNFFIIRTRCLFIDNVFFLLLR